MSHYFINDPSLKDSIKYYDVQILSTSFRFYTNAGVFSQNALDYGTKVLLENIEITPNCKTIIDAGCGYGPIGIFIAKRYPHTNVIMADINLRALELTKHNLKINDVNNAEVINSDFLTEITNKADVIITNPPIRAGKEAIFKLYEQSYEKLNNNGHFYCVIQKKQGAPSTFKKLSELFNDPKIIKKDKGYWVILATKNENID